MTKIAPCLWFDDQAEEAAKYYTGIFKNSKILETAYYTEAGQATHGRPAGSVMTVAFELDGRRFTGLNGGPQFKFSEAVSFQIDCETQEEVDYYWDRLGAGGAPGPCGWVRDKFGLSWQVVPVQLNRYMRDQDRAKASRVMEAMLKMGKLDIATLKRAHEGA